jgi:hypothetical protein
MAPRAAPRKSPISREKGSGGPMIRALWGQGWTRLAVAVHLPIGSVYASLLRYVGGRAFEAAPWKGLLLALGIALTVTASWAFGEPRRQWPPRPRLSALSSQLPRGWEACGSVSACVFGSSASSLRAMEQLVSLAYLLQPTSVGR